MDFIKNEIIKVAKLAFQEGLVNAFAGNISYTYKSDMYITKRGSFFGDLTEKDIVKVNLNKGVSSKASSEFFVHKAIYVNTNKKAILHTHPKYTVLASFFYNKVEPIDSEGKLIFKDAPVLDVNPPSSSKVLEEALSLALKHHSIVIVKTHGVFAASNTLMEAYAFTGALEHSSFMLLKAKNMIK
ncbi:class II aldolase/adducin family protein [Hydrogenobaculum acidophilum]